MTWLLMPSSVDEDVDGYEEHVLEVKPDVKDEGNTQPRRVSANESLSRPLSRESLLAELSGLGCQGLE
jgi:hypothetical protein